MEMPIYMQYPVLVIIEYQSNDLPDVRFLNFDTPKKAVEAANVINEQVVSPQLRIKATLLFTPPAAWKTPL